MYVGPLTSLGHRESNAGTYVSVPQTSIIFIIRMHQELYIDKCA